MGKSEEWKQIKDFPNYYISNKGRVASNGMKQGNKVYGFRILKPLDKKRKTHKGYTWEFETL